MSFSVKILWSFVRLDRPWFICHSPKGAKKTLNGTWLLQKPVTAISYIIHSDWHGRVNTVVLGHFFWGLMYLRVSQ